MANNPTTKQQKVYQVQLKAWQKSRPKNGSQYDFERWLEERPQPPGRVKELTYDDRC